MRLGCASFNCLSVNVQLGWRPLVESYMKKLPDAVVEEDKKLILDMVEWLVQPSLGMSPVPSHLILQIYIYQFTPPPSPPPTPLLYRFHSSRVPSVHQHFSSSNGQLLS